MAFANELAPARHTPTSVVTTARGTFDIAHGGITGSHLVVNADVPGLGEEQFQEIAAAKVGCPVSKALTGIDVTLEAILSLTIPHSDLGPSTPPTHAAVAGPRSRRASAPQPPPTSSPARRSGLPAIADRRVIRMP